MVSLVAPVQVQACGEAGFIEIAKGTFTYNGQSSIGDAPKGVVLDMDSSVSPTHGEQEMSVWNGHTIVHCCVCGCRKQESFVEINRRSFPDVIISKANLDWFASFRDPYQANSDGRNPRARANLKGILSVTNQLVRSISQPFSFESSAASSKKSQNKNNEIYPIKAIVFWLIGAVVGVGGILIAILLAPRYGDWCGYFGLVLWVPGLSFVILPAGSSGTDQHPLIAVPKMSAFSRLLYRNWNSAT
jgi:hypothetical protein